MNMDARYFRLRKEFDKRGYNGTKWIGCMAEIAETMRPVDEKDWKEKYYQYCAQTGLIDKINTIQNTLNQYEDIEYVKEFMYDRLITKPYNGYKSEVVVMTEYLLQHNRLLHKTDLKLDMAYGVDLIEKDSTGQIIKAIQVKYGVQKNSQEQLEKMADFERIYGIKILTVNVSKCQGEWYISRGYEELGIPKYKKPSSGLIIEFK